MTLKTEKDILRETDYFIEFSEKHEQKNYSAQLKIRTHLHKSINIEIVKDILHINNIAVSDQPDIFAAYIYVFIYNTIKRYEYPERYLLYVYNSVQEPKFTIRAPGLNNGVRDQILSWVKELCLLGLDPERYEQGRKLLSETELEILIGFYLGKDAADIYGT